MKNLYYSYPTYITQPQNVSDDSKKIDSVQPTTIKNLDSISYPNLDDYEYNSSNRSKSSSPSPKINNDLSTNNSLNGKHSGNNNSFSGSHPSPLLPINVDRSTKPKSSASNIPNGPANHSHGNIPSGAMMNGLAKTSKVDPADLKREAVNAALDDIIKSSKEVSKVEEKLSELRSQAQTCSLDEAMAVLLKNKEEEVAELTNLLKNKDENFVSIYSTQFLLQRSVSH